LFGFTSNPAANVQPQKKAAGCKKKSKKIKKNHLTACEYAKTVYINSVDSKKQPQPQPKQRRK